MGPGNGVEAKAEGGEDAEKRWPSYVYYSIPLGFEFMLHVTRALCGKFKGIVGKEFGNNQTKLTCKSSSGTLYR